jgi:rRNA-processing protein FCF1
MKLAVQDANIIIDLIKIDLWQLALQLDLEIYTTDFVVGELDEDQVAIIQPYIDEGQFKVRTFDADEVMEIFGLNERIPALSAVDCSVLQAAQADGAMVLTGDKRLRNEVSNNQVEVHGILWIFDELLRVEILDFSQASAKLKMLMNLNARLPKKECQLRLTKWGN